MVGDEPESLPLLPEPPRPVADIPVVLLLPRPPHPNFWWAMLWCVGFLVFQLAVQFGVTIVGAVIVFASNPGEVKQLTAAMDAKAPSEEREAAFKVLAPVLGAAIAGQEAGAILFAVLMARLVVGAQWPRRLGVRRPHWADAILAVLAVPGILALSNLAYELTAKVVPGFNYQQMVLETIQRFPTPFSLMAFALAPGISEELVLRGVIGRGLVARHGVWLGVFLTSLLFGLLHLDPPHVAATLVLGVGLHCVYLASRSLLLPVLLHVANNGLAVLTVMQVGPLAALKAPEHPVPLYVASCLLLAAVGWAMFQSRAEVVPAIARGWRPDFPGVEGPPPASDSTVVPRRLSWLATFAVAAMLCAWAATAYVALP